MYEANEGSKWGKKHEYESSSEDPIRENPVREDFPYRILKIYNAEDIMKESIMFRNVTSIF